ncbi:MAG: class I SAM-dependent methyltransferase [Solirubrobacterales bacterium]
MIDHAAKHWMRVYSAREPAELSWFEAVPAVSLRMIKAADLRRDAAIIDVGGGASRLAGELVDRGYVDVTVADVSPPALAAARAELGERAGAVDWVGADVRSHDFGRAFDLWHDRATLHFMVDDGDRRAYLATLRASLRPGGFLVIATFGPEGPSECSGLPVRRYGPEELTAALGAEFELLMSELTAHRTPRGSEQQFHYALLRRAG